MPRRVVDLRGSERPLLDVVSYGRAVHFTPRQRQQILLTIHHVPEVMVKVSGGARTLAGVEQHMAYIGREGEVGLETDMGRRVGGQKFAHDLVRDWDLDVEVLSRQSERSIRGRKPTKLVHNIIFSMPPGTLREKVLKAVRQLAVNEWQLRHRYAMTMHNDTAHPHVHVVVKAMSEQGTRLNIRKVTQRSWRAQFAANLRELGIAANATERAVRGQSKTRKSDPIFRANQRGQSTHVGQRRAQVIRELSLGELQREEGWASITETRAVVSAGWRRLGAILDANGDHKLAEEVRSFDSRMSPVWTEKEWLARELLTRSRGYTADRIPLTR
jgi:hypothetical protein